MFKLNYYNMLGEDSAKGRLDSWTNKLLAQMSFSPFFKKDFKLPTVKCFQHALSIVDTRDGFETH